MSEESDAQKTPQAFLSKGVTPGFLFGSALEEPVSVPVSVPDAIDLGIALGNLNIDGLDAKSEPVAASPFVPGNYQLGNEMYGEFPSFPVHPPFSPNMDMFKAPNGAMEAAWGFNGPAAAAPFAPMFGAHGGYAPMHQIRPFALPEVPEFMAPTGDTFGKERGAPYHPGTPLTDDVLVNMGANPMWGMRNSFDNRWSAAPSAAPLMNVHRRNNKRKGEDASKFVNAVLGDFAGEIYLLCKDQHGCRFLQRQLDGDEEVVALMIFNEIYLHIVELMTDPFGNYLIQKLFEKVSVAQRVILVKNAAPQFVRVALDPHGTRALQKLVECVSTDEESSLVIAALATHIVSLSRDLNGNHVVQKCLQKLKPADNQFIFDAAAEHCMEVATHRHGCCVLQRCLDNGSPAQRAQLSARVAAHCLQLSLDPFGNYVVQYVLFKGDSDSVAAIVKAIRSDIVNLSLHKFGSNVIEKSLRSDNAFIPRQLIEALLDHKLEMSRMLHDPYGNYVLQTSLDVCTKDDFERLSGILKPLLPNVRNTPHGRRISARIHNVLS